MVKIDENSMHFALGYRRAVLHDCDGDILTINILPKQSSGFFAAFISIGDEHTVAVTHDELKQLKEFFASL